MIFVFLRKEFDTMLGLNPEPVWNYFEEVSEVPRRSKNEEKIGEYVLSVAKEHNLESRQDEGGNILIRKPATIDFDSPTTVLQAHMGVVCKKNEDLDHDFSTDPIP